MSKIPFDIKYRPQIESGEYKVETRDGKKVRVLCYDANNIVPVVALVTFNDGSEGSRDYYHDGSMNFDRENPLDLFIVTPEPELTEFEQEVSDIVEYCKEHGENVAFDYAKRHAKTLLAFAKKELCNGCNANLEGYIKGQQDAKRQHDESVAYHFPIMPQRPLCYEPGGTCTNPQMDCINCPRWTTGGGGFSTSSGTSTSKAEE